MPTLLLGHDCTQRARLMKKHTNSQPRNPANNPKQKNLTNPNVSRNVSIKTFHLYKSHVLRGLQTKVRVSLGHHLAVPASL